MRILDPNDLRFVAGGNHAPAETIIFEGEVVVIGGRTKGNNGFGNGGEDGVPGHSDFQDVTR